MPVSRSRSAFNSSFHDIFVPIELNIESFWLSSDEMTPLNQMIIKIEAFGEDAIESGIGTDTFDLI